MKAKAVVLAMVMASFFVSCSGTQSEAVVTDTTVVSDTVEVVVDSTLPEEVKAEN